MTHPVHPPVSEEELTLGITTVHDKRNIMLNRDTLRKVASSVSERLRTTSKPFMVACDEALRGNLPPDTLRDPSRVSAYRSAVSTIFRNRQSRRARTRRTHHRAPPPRMLYSD